MRVVDHGPGIPARERERIFEPFVRGANGEAEQGSGSGWRSRAASSTSTAGGSGWSPSRGGHDVRRRAAGGRACPLRRANERRPRPRRRRRAADPACPADEAPRRGLCRRHRRNRAGGAHEGRDAAARRRSSSTSCLPDGRGTDVCRELREWSTAPILVLSAVGEEAEKIDGARRRRRRLRDEAVQRRRAARATARRAAPRAARRPSR